MLANDLIELLKMDKRAIWGEATLGNTAESAAKAAKVATQHFKSALGKLRNKGKAILSGDKQLSGTDVDREETPQLDNHAVTDDEIYTEGCQNEQGEDVARVAFCVFYLCVMGNLSWYLSTNPVGQTPTFDRERFLQQKRQLGNGEGSPMFPLLTNMCQSQMFEQFVKARVDEILLRVPVSKDSPLFLVCANYHRQHQIDFTVTNVRRVTRQVAQVNPSRLMSQANADARRNAMALTSNKQFEGDQGRVVAQLVESCHETSILMDVMSVIWLRLRDCKGMNWKHGLSSLQILRNLLYHGPIAAIAEATDGLDKIRVLKSYQNQMRGSTAQQIQQAASQVYELLVDRSKLFSLRRVCANRRRQLNEGKQESFQRDRNLKIFAPFRSLHPYLNPQNNRRVAPVPQQQAQQGRPGPIHMDSNVLVQPQSSIISLNHATPDWLDHQPSSSQRIPPPQQQEMHDILGVLSISSLPPQQSTPLIDPFAPVSHEIGFVPQQGSIDPFAPASQRAPRSLDPFAPVPPTLVSQSTQLLLSAPQPIQAHHVVSQPTFANLPVNPQQHRGGYPTYAQMPPQQQHQQHHQPPPGNISTHQPGYPSQQSVYLQQPPGAYHHQEHNPFAASPVAPQQGPPQPQCQPNVNQFDPLRRDPFG